MKGLIIALFLFAFVNAQASIEYVAHEAAPPSSSEIAKSRACFEEVSKYGCGDPGEDLPHFRSCLHEAHPSLSDDCRKMMTSLYKRRD